LQNTANKSSNFKLWKALELYLKFSKNSFKILQIAKLTIFLWKIVNPSYVKRISSSIAFKDFLITLREPAIIK